MKKILLIILLFLAFPGSVEAYYTNMPASVVIGQPDFTSSSANQGGSVSANTFNAPGKMIVVNNKLIVSDRTNNRVLIFNQVPTNNNASADVVIGQADMASGGINQGAGLTSPAINSLSNPGGLFSDGQRLFIADTNNNRVLIFNSIPTTNNASADVVIGQSDFTSRSTGANNMNNPQAIVLANGKLLISDFNQSRILVWNSVPTTNSLSSTADVVIGQTSLSGILTNQGGSAGANTLRQPVGLSVSEDGKLAIGDLTNNRVLIFNQIPTSNNASADVVVGQSSFSAASANQGASASASTLSGPRHLEMKGNRLFIGDAVNNRVLIYNSIPVANNASADLVIGQSDFSGTSSDQGSSVSARGFNAPRDVGVFGNSLFISDFSNNRLLLFNNILSGPQLSMNTPVPNSGGKLIVTGNIQLGERPHYSLQRMQANVNGQGFGNVLHLTGGTDDGPGQTRYEFFHEFEPWAGISSRDTYTPSTGYTLQLKASSFNAEEDQIFYFTPFSIKSVVGNQINLTINKDHWQRIKDNLDSFEIQTKKNNVWTTLLDKIPLDPETITSTKTLSGEVRIVAKDRWGHRQTVANSINTGVGITSYNTNFKFATPGFPLQINKISGVNTGIISTYMSMPKTSFTISTSRPVFSGIAYSGSEVTILVTDPVIGRSQTFQTITKTDSSWNVTPTLYNTSVIDVWVTDSANRYTELPTFKLSVLRSEL